MTPSDDDDFPWSDAWRWSPDDDGCIPPPEPSTELDGLVLTAELDDGRRAQWSRRGGWEGDQDVISAAQAVAALWPELPDAVRNARGLFGASVDGWASETCWIAAKL